MFSTHSSIVVHAEGAFWDLVWSFLLAVAMDFFWSYQRTQWTYFLNVEGRKFSSFVLKFKEKMHLLILRRANMKNVDDLNLYITDSIHVKYL